MDSQGTKYTLLNDGISAPNPTRNRTFILTREDEEPKITFSDVLRLLRVSNIPGTPEDHTFLVSSTQSLVDRYSEAWITENRLRLLDEYDYILSM